MYKEQFKSNDKYIEILSKLTLIMEEKQIKFEEITQLSEDFWNVTKNQQFYVMYFKLYTQLNFIRWLNLLDIFKIK